MQAPASRQAARAGRTGPAAAAPARFPAAARCRAPSRRANTCRPAATAAAAPPAAPRAREGGVFVSMQGAPLLELAAGHNAVPLLAPERDEVPLAAALRIIQPGAAPAQVLGASTAGTDTVELLYVLTGSGHLLGADGARQAVGPGDSVIAAQGAPMFEVPVTSSDDDVSGAKPLVMLQLLLPGKLLRDIAGGQGSAFTPFGELGIRPEWAAPAVLKAGRLSGELMCRLLSPDAETLARAEGRSAERAARAGEHEQQMKVADALASSDPLASADPSEVRLPPLAGDRPLLKRSTSGVRAWRLPNATNQLALLFGPHTDPELSLTFGVEMFEPGHRTTRHIHTQAYEMFVVLGGEGLAISGKDKIPIRAGDIAVFPPYVVHAVDNPSDRRLYCLQMMLPNDMFAEYVTSGDLMGPLDSDDMGDIITGTC